MTDHLVPFQISASACSVNPSRDEEPTATQFVELTQETPVRKLKASGLGLEATDHAPPFQVSISDFDVVWSSAEELPTATQLVELTHETASRTSPPGSLLTAVVPGLGLGTTDQMLPSQASIRVRPGTRGLTEEPPTAIQLVELTQETPSRESVKLPALGLGTTDQVVPLLASIRVWSPSTYADAL
ncbi:MAG: hypothetical protein ABSF33_02145 [Acidimicrobiales bacterium]